MPSYEVGEKVWWRTKAVHTKAGPAKRSDGREAAFNWTGPWYVRAKYSEESYGIHPEAPGVSNLYAPTFHTTKTSRLRKCPPSPLLPPRLWGATHHPAAR
jgi:hypothetical protein